MGIKKNLGLSEKTDSEKVNLLSSTNVMVKKIKICKKNFVAILVLVFSQH